MIAKLANPGNFNQTIKLMVAQSGFAGLDFRTSSHGGQVVEQALDAFR
jgi:hypothetical protein